MERENMQISGFVLYLRTSFSGALDKPFGPGFARRMAGTSPESIQTNRASAHDAGWGYPVQDATRFVSIQRMRQSPILPHWTLATATRLTFAHSTRWAQQTDSRVAPESPHSADWSEN